MSADDLPRNTRLDLTGNGIKRFAGHVDRTEIRKIESSIATHGQAQVAILRSVQLNVELISWTNHIIGGDRHVASRSERGDPLVEEFVTERFEGGVAGAIKRQPHQLHFQLEKRWLRLQSLGCLDVCQTRQGYGSQARKLQYAVPVDGVGITLPEKIDDLGELQALFLRVLGSRFRRDHDRGNSLTHELRSCRAIFDEIDG